MIWLLAHVSSIEENIKLWAENSVGHELQADNFSVIEFKLQEVGFSGDAQHTLKKTGTANFNELTERFASEGNTVISNPVWQDMNLDGDVNDPGDIYDPICFTKSSKPTISAKIVVKPSLTASLVGQICLTVPQADVTLPDYLMIQKEVSILGTVLDINGISETAFANIIKDGDLPIRWKISINDRPPIKFCESKHRTFLTYGIPVGSSVTAKRMAWSTQACQGCSNLNLDNMPRMMQLAVRKEGAPHFFVNPEDCMALENPWSLFDPKIVGPCVTFSEVMARGLQMLGVPSNRTVLTSVTAHKVSVANFLGESAGFDVYRTFREWSGGFWVNEGVCGVNTDGNGWLYYDVAGGTTVGSFLGHTVGAQYPTLQTGLVDNQWREPEPSYGPIMKEWTYLPSYAIDYRDYLTHFIKVKSPNGGEIINVGTLVDVRFYTAALQGFNVDIYYYSVTTGAVTKIGTVAIAAAATEGGNFSKESSIVWNTAGLPPGQYFIGVVVKESTANDSMYLDWSDDSFELQ